MHRVFNGLKTLSFAEVISQHRDIRNDVPHVLSKDACGIVRSTGDSTTSPETQISFQSRLVLQAEDCLSGVASGTDSLQSALKQE